MGVPRPFDQEKLVIAVLISEATLSEGGFRERLLARLQQAFGPTDYLSETLPFSFTHYYDQELGAPLSRLFVAFRTLVDPQTLARLKIQTNAIEDEFRAATPGAGGGRRVNLDPGLLSSSRFVLASTKDGSHRIPLAEGIFAEITLQYRRPCFHPVPWTYPDYRSEEVREVLLQIRNLLKAPRADSPKRRLPGRKRRAPPPNGPRPG